MQSMEPYTMTVKNAAAHFGYHHKTIYDMLGKQLQFGNHYLKVGGKVLIKVEAFKKYLHQEAGVSDEWMYIECDDTFALLNEEFGVIYGND
jgi:excisionase family DNA binding protein